MFCCSLVSQSCPTLCNPMDCITPGFPVHHQLLELAQIHVHQVSPWCHPTISSSVTPFSSCFQSFSASGLFKWVSSSHQVTKVLELQLQHQSRLWIFRVDFLWDLLVWSPCYTRDSQESSPAPKFKRISSSVLNFLYGPTLTSIHDYWKKHSFD